MPSDIHEAANSKKKGGIAWILPSTLYRHYSGVRFSLELLYRNYIKLYVSFCAARPGFVAYLFVVQYTTAVLYRCFYIRFVLPLITLRVHSRRRPVRMHAPTAPGCNPGSVRRRRPHAGGCRENGRRASRRSPPAACTSIHSSTSSGR